MIKTFDTFINELKTPNLNPSTFKDLSDSQRKNVIKLNEYIREMQNEFKQHYDGSPIAKKCMMIYGKTSLIKDIIEDLNLDADYYSNDSPDPKSMFHYLCIGNNKFIIFNDFPFNDESLDIINKAIDYKNDNIVPSPDTKEKIRFKGFIIIITDVDPKKRFGDDVDKKFKFIDLH